ncbi:NADH-quinone oxidoreductase subunit F [Alphaproteobacteria bacterium 46_93_T64]|nr:NADH-quinone oxidoreductase subunit F [Alphaproteobacteria bacterium 46_93_T64]
MTSSASFTQTTKAPGKARKSGKGRYHARGRQVAPEARETLEKLLHGKGLSKDLLIENLHILQDEFGHLKKDHLAALAEAMRLSLAEVYEVATFYHNFVVLEDEKIAPKIILKVCDSLSCCLAGGDDLFKELKKYGSTEVTISHGACMGRCDTAPVVRIGDTYIENATQEKSSSALKLAMTRPQEISKPDGYPTIEEYRVSGGFRILKELQSNKIDSNHIIENLKESGHRGLGGAGFPHAMKISSVLSIPGPRYMAVNADESEPGTFKDRHYMNSHPFQFLDGMLIGAELVDAKEIYIFLRDEYPETATILKDAIADIEEAGLNNDRKIFLRRGAGAYICGEESAMLESLEGKRALPRAKPPFPAHVGLFGKPTLINNVETLYWLPEILEKGSDWYKQGGRHGSTGFRTFSLSGHVNKPGVYLTPAGITASELIEEYGGGMQEGHTFKAYLPGGASGGILPSNMADIPLDFGTLEKHGCFVGSAAVIVLSDQDNMKEVGRNLMRFFEDESCGQCTPCRVGTEKAVKVMEGDVWDLTLLQDLSDVMQDASICGLGQAAPNGLLGLMKYFPEELA